MNTLLDERPDVPDNLGPDPDPGDGRNWMEIRGTVIGHRPDAQYDVESMATVLRVSDAISLGLLTINALTAANEVFVPIQAEYYALEGVTMLWDNIAMVRQYLNPRVSIMGILLTMYDPRTNLSRDVADEVRRHFPDLVFSSVIPRSVRVSEAPSFRRTVIDYDRNSAGAVAYREAALEFAQRGVY